jgi:hypothetical protein
MQGDGNDIVRDEGTNVLTQIGFVDGVLCAFDALERVSNIGVDCPEIHWPWGHCRDGTNSKAMVVCTNTTCLVLELPETCNNDSDQRIVTAKWLLVTLSYLGRVRLRYSSPMC